MSDKLEMPSPTEEDLASPEFEAIWQLIKSWDVNVPSHYEGYCGANGSHAKMILDALRAATVVERQELAVWEGSMPESNGKSNFTVILHTGDLTEGICVYRSEYPDRARYEADCFRHLIGDPAFPEKPFICDYDADKHSGYVKPDISPPAPVAVVLPDRRTPKDYNGYIPSYASEAAAIWNACLDKVKELNQ